MRARSEQHNGPPISTVSEHAGLAMPAHYGSTSVLQPAVSVAHRQLPSRFVSPQQPAQHQRSFSSSSQQFVSQSGVQPVVAVVAPFNINQLPTASTNSLHQSIYQSQQQYSQFGQQDKTNLGEFGGLTKEQYYQQQYGSSEYTNCQQEEDLTASYKECEQLGAQLAPFLPQEEIFELCDDMSLLPMDIEGLFPEFDSADFFTIPSAQQKIVAEFDVGTKNLGQSNNVSTDFLHSDEPYFNQVKSAVPTKRARFNSSFDVNDDRFISNLVD